MVIGIGGGAEAETGDTGAVARAGIGTGGGGADQDPEAMEVTGDTAGAEVATEGEKNDQIQCFSYSSFQEVKVQIRCQEDEKGEGIWKPRKP